MTMIKADLGARSNSFAFQCALTSPAKPRAIPLAGFAVTTEGLDRETFSHPLTENATLFTGSIPISDRMAARRLNPVISND